MHTSTALQEYTRAHGDIIMHYTTHLPSLRTMLVCWLAKPLSSLGVCKNGQKRTSKHRDSLPPHSPSRGSNYKFTILSVVQSVLNLTGRTGGEVEWVGVGSSALLPPSPSSPLLAVLGGVSSSPCDGWVVSNSLSGNPVPPASALDPIPGWGC